MQCFIYQFEQSCNHGKHAASNLPFNQYRELGKKTLISNLFVDGSRRQSNFVSRDHERDNDDCKIPCLQTKKISNPKEELVQIVLVRRTFRPGSKSNFYKYQYLFLLENNSTFYLVKRIQIKSRISSSKN